MDPSDSFIKNDLQGQPTNESIISNPTGHTTLPLPTASHYQQIKSDTEQQQQPQQQQQQQQQPQMVTSQSSNQTTNTSQPQQVPMRQYVQQVPSNMVPQQQQYVKSEVKNEVHDGSQSVQVVKQQPNTQIIQAPAHLVSAHRVAEILKAAGETFCRLGECTMMLDQTAQPSKTKWYDSDVGELAETVQRFKDDLGRLSATMQQRTSQKLRDQLQKQAQKGGMRPRQSSGGQMDGQMRQQVNRVVQRPNVQMQQPGQAIKRDGMVQQQSGQPEKRQRISSGQQVQQSGPNQGGVRQQYKQVVSRQIQQQPNTPQQQRQNGQKVPISQRSPIMTNTVTRSPASQSGQMQVERQPQQQQQQQQQQGQQQFTYQQSNNQGQRLVQVNQQGQQISSSNNQGQQIQVSQQGQNINQGQAQRVTLGPSVQFSGGAKLVMGPDQNGPTYTVQETIIDGKKTLILDHNDLQRLLQQNNGSAVVLHGGGDGQGQQNQIVTVQMQQPNH